MKLQQYLAKREQQINRALDRCLGDSNGAAKLHEAMRYSLFAGGKRIRPVLALAATEAVDGPLARTMAFACALEMIHTYSLIHDDLPAMDDDSLRRGKPSNHVVYGEAMAILAGDALLTEAFRVMAESVAAAGKARTRAAQVLVELTVAAGARGMVAGQAADMLAENTDVNLPTVELIHVRKTGALIRAAVRGGAVLGGATAGQLRRLTRFAEYLGLAFQITDDILDVEGTTSRTGKLEGRDMARHKATFPGVLGMPAAKARAQELLVDMLAQLEPFGRKAEPLREIARFVVDRALPT